MISVTPLTVGRSIDAVFYATGEFPLCGALGMAR